MPNSVLREKGFIIFYSCLWGVFALFFGLFLFYYASIPAGIAIPDALVSSLILSVFLLSLWFVIRYSDGENVLSRSVLLHSLAGLMVIIPLWLFSSVMLLDILFKSYHLYLDFLHTSYLLRAFYGTMMGAVVFFTLLTSNMKRYTREASQRESTLRDLVQHTELQALKNQLNPHFIYNSLNSISSLTITAPDKAREMVIRLSDFLRYALRQDATQLTTLRQEVENSRLYLQIEQVRFGERLQFELNINEKHLNWPLPVMILQPLFENAVKHGFLKSSIPATIILRAQESSMGLRLELSNQYDAQFARFRGEGVGLENIRNRLRLIYGNGNLLQVKAREGDFVATLDLPR